MSSTRPPARVRLTNPIALLAPALAAAGTLWCWWTFRHLGDSREQLTRFFGWFALAFTIYLGTLWLVRCLERSDQPPRVRAALFGVILLAAIGGRWLLLPVTPTLSDDMYRYRWDGRVQLAGIDPYRYPPNHPSLAFLRDADFSRINFPHLRTIYPPLMEWAFRLGAHLGDTLAAQKTVFLCAEAMTCLSLLFILRRRRRSPLWVVAYAWHPLVLLEVAGQGHNDAVGISLLWLGLAAWEASRPAWAAMAWASAFLAKLVSVILVPWWWCRRRTRSWLLAFLICAALPLAIHWRMLHALTETLSAMTGRGSSNASLYEILAWLVGSRSAALFMALGLWMALVVWWARREADPIRYLCKTLAAAALLAPALHPWYLTWLVPCFCFRRAPALILLTGTVVLAYTVWPGYLGGGHWAMPWWARIAEYAPVLLVAAGQWLITRMRKPSMRSSAAVVAPGSSSL